MNYYVQALIIACTMRILNREQRNQPIVQWDQLFISDDVQSYSYPLHPSESNHSHIHMNYHPGQASLPHQQEMNSPRDKRPFSLVR